MKVLTVSEFNQAVKLSLEEGMGEVVVLGEVSGFRIAREKLVYFELKDERSRVLCFLLAWDLTQPLEDGMEIKVYGRPSLFLASGGFHLRVREVELVGAGALTRAYQLLVKKLEKEGLFAVERKRPLPRFPSRIGLITSAGAAAYTDVLRILNERWTGFVVRFLPVAVQGRGAVKQIVLALRHMSEAEQVDLVILTRGGGSLEDLQAFNSEDVARAIAASRPPVVCGVGHERDVTIADLTADVRATTPTNAAQLSVPDRREIAAEIRRSAREVATAVSGTVADQRERVESSLDAFVSFFDRQRHAVESLVRPFPQFVLRFLQHQRARLEHLAALLRTLSPEATLRRGYSITFDDATGGVLRSARGVRPNRSIRTRLADGSLRSTVTETL